MKIVLKAVSGKEYTPDDVTQMILTETVGVPCNSLSVKFKSNDPLDEIVAVKVYSKDRLIFNGYCDNQRITESGNGFGIYIYARSSACLLVDNEAQPFTYKCPTAKQLHLNNTQSLGFECLLPEISGNDKYQVVKGTSKYGAVNNFVSLITGSPVYITPDNEIRLYEKSEAEKNLADYDILSFTSVINRSEPMSQVNYKDDSSYSYNLHIKSQTGEDMGISRERYLNLSSLPRWQRDFSAAYKLRTSFEDYKILEVTVSGYVKEELCCAFFYSGKAGDFYDYILTEKKYCQDGGLAYTRLILKKSVDIKEITYVD